VILADSLSTDRTVEIARLLPIQIVQLKQPGDRRCGAAAQLGYQFARGAFILLVDADMELQRGFVAAALAELAADPRLAAVGGQQIEMSESLEYQERQRRGRRTPGPALSIGGSAMYRASAVREAGYFMNRNLHCAEEFELAARLRARGWRLRMLACDAFRHHGHTDPAIGLLFRRWRTRFFTGYGAMLRGAWRKPHFADAVRVCAIPLATVGWWMLLAVLAAASVFDRRIGLVLMTVAVMPLAALVIRKRSLSRALHALTLWQFHAAALLQGLCARQAEPTQPIAASVVQERRQLV